MRGVPQSVARAWESLCEAYRSYVEREVFPACRPPWSLVLAGFEVEKLLHGWEPFLDGDPVDVPMCPPNQPSNATSGGSLGRRGTAVRETITGQASELQGQAAACPRAHARCRATPPDAHRG